MTIGEKEKRGRESFCAHPETTPDPFSVTNSHA